MKLSKLGLLKTLTAVVALILICTYGQYKQYQIAIAEFLFQLGLIFLLSAQISAQTDTRVNRFTNSENVFLLAIIFAFFADCLYSVRVLKLIETAETFHVISELLYGCFALSLVAALLMGVRGLPKPLKVWDLTATITFICVLLISYFSVLIRYYSLPLPLILKLNATMYALSTSLMFSILVSFSFRIHNRSQYWFVQTLLLYLISDFSIRYQSSFISVSTYSWSEYGYCFTFIGLFLCHLFVGELNSIPTKFLKVNLKVLDSSFQYTALVSPFSLRSIFTLSICGSNMLVIAGILLSYQSHLPTGDQVSIALFLMYICWFAANEISWRFTSKLEKLIESMFRPVESISDGELTTIRLNTVENPTQIFEISKIIESYNSLALRTNSMITLIEKANRDASLARLASQVSHDIRSPLSALNYIVSDIVSLPENSRMMIKEATNRINDIANDLLHFKKEQAQGNIQLEDSVFMISNVVEAVVSEKRMLTKFRQNILVETLNSVPYGTFISANPSKLHRALSNLIENSIESLKNDSGFVHIQLKVEKNLIAIEINDSGCGMPNHILDQLGTDGFTFGKVGTKSGSGMGFSYSKRTIEEMNGQISVSSHVDVGTNIIIQFPMVAPPSWFIEHISLTSSSTLVIIDDDESIHQTWADRFRNISEASNTKIFHFRSLLAFSQWWSHSVNEFSHIVFLVDLEFSSTKQSEPYLDTYDGLKIIELEQIMAHSILVTSHYDEEKVKARCIQLGVKLLPKHMAGFVPIKFSNENSMTSVKSNNAVAEAIPINSLPIDYLPIDAVLIDDDELVRLTWSLGAKLHQKNIQCFETFASFLQNMHQFSHETPIYIDYELGSEKNGVECASHIYAHGFMKIFIATGHDKSFIGTYPFVTDVVGKNNPWKSN